MMQKPGVIKVLGRLKNRKRAAKMMNGQFQIVIGERCESANSLNIAKNKEISNRNEVSITISNKKAQKPAKKKIPYGSDNKRSKTAPSSPPSLELSDSEYELDDEFPKLGKPSYASLFTSSSSNTSSSTPATTSTKAEAMDTTEPGSSSDK